MGRYLPLRPRRFAVSLLAAAVLVPVLAVVTKSVVEALAPVRYEIHWLETVPALVLLFGFVIHGYWNERAERAA